MTQAQLSVTVLPRYLEEHSQPAQNEYAWSYTVTIVNTGTVSAQVVGRHWVITDATGLVEEVRGLALVGHQPLIPPGEKFEYTSGCQLDTAVGTMRGSFQITAEDGTQFEAAIDEFTLSIPRVLH